MPMPVMPAWDVDACVKEAERVAGLGLRGVNMTSDPQDLGAPDLANRAWDPLWEVCADLAPAGALPHRRRANTAMDFFGKYFWPSQDEYVKPAIGGSMLFIGNARVLINTIFAGIFDRFPKLQMVLGRERHRLDPVHPRDDGLRAVGERPGAVHGAVEEAVGVLQASTGTPPSGSRRTRATCRPGRHGRRGQRSCSRPTSRTRPASTPSPLDTVAEKMDGAAPGDPPQDHGRERRQALPAVAARRMTKLGDDDFGGIGCDGGALGVDSAGGHVPDQDHDRHCEYRGRERVADTNAPGGTGEPQPVGEGRPEGPGEDV